MRSEFISARSIREEQHNLIWAFLENAADHHFLRGRVLDFGCGKQPYRSIVEKWDSEYFGWDREYLPGSVVAEDVGEGSPFPVAGWDSILCTQMLQYVPSVRMLMDEFANALARSRGYLVLTYATNWPEIESTDRHRFTRFGMERLCREARLRILEQQEIGSVECADFVLPLGYGLVATPH